MRGLSTQGRHVAAAVAGALLLALASAAALAPAGAMAQQKTQGSPLTAAANYQYGCETRWLPGSTPPFDMQPITIGPSTCTIFQSGTTTDDTHLVPAPGTILSARIKSGPNPAPLQITTMRRYFKPNAQGQMEYTCCHGISQTPTFQPKPNDITEVPVNLLVSTQQPENGQTGWWDIVAVSAEGPGTLPIADRGPHPTIGSPGMPTTFWYYPKVAPSENNQNEWSASNFEVLMNFTWCPGTGRTAAAVAAQACPSTAPPPPPPGGNDQPGRTGQPSGTPSAAVGARRLTSNGSSVTVPVTCSGASACRGRVRLRTRARRPVLLASRRFTVATGKTGKVRLALSRRARRRLGARRTQVRVELALAGAPTVTKDLTLVRAAARRARGRRRR
jgi:hypothetical protein